jgi:hypothetical protein
VPIPGMQLLCHLLLCDITSGDNFSKANEGIFRSLAEFLVLGGIIGKFFRLFSFKRDAEAFSGMSELGIRFFT